MSALAIIAGTGALDLFEIVAEKTVETAWGTPSSALAEARPGSRPVLLLARHGRPHRIPPHRVNYRANIAALAQAGAGHVIAINAVGGIDPALPAGALVLPDQLIDYTWGRGHSFSDGAEQPLAHIEFAEPFAGATRTALLEAATATGIAVYDGGCYGATQGPRLETAAEIRRLANDGCTLVGMTAMPEAALAREAGLDYASLCVVANPAAGVCDEPISIDEIHRVLDRAMAAVGRLLGALDYDRIAAS